MNTTEQQKVIVSYYSRLSGVVHRVCEIKTTTPKGWLKIIFEGNPVTLRPQKYRSDYYEGVFGLGRIEAVPFVESVWAEKQNEMKKREDEKARQEEERRKAREEAEAKQNAEIDELKSKMQIDFEKDLTVTKKRVQDFYGMGPEFKQSAPCAGKGRFGFRYGLRTAGRYPLDDS